MGVCYKFRSVNSNSKWYILEVEEEGVRIYESTGEDQLSGQEVGEVEEVSCEDLFEEPTSPSSSM